MQTAAYLQHFFSIKKVKDAQDKEKQENFIDPILLEIAEVTQQLQNIRRRFDYEIEYDMIDSCIYEEQALLSRYRHLICTAKEKGITCTPTQSYSFRSIKD